MSFTFSFPLAASGKSCAAPSQQQANGTTAAVNPPVARGQADVKRVLRVVYNRNPAAFRQPQRQIHLLRCQGAAVFLGLISYINRVAIAALPVLVRDVPVHSFHHARCFLAVLAGFVQRVEAVDPDCQHQQRADE